MSDVVLVPSDGKSLTHFWTDKYIPDCHNQKAPLIIKSTPGHFQVKKYKTQTQINGNLTKAEHMHLMGENVLLVQSLTQTDPPIFCQKSF